MKTVIINTKDEKKLYFYSPLLDQFKVLSDAVECEEKSEISIDLPVMSEGLENCFKFRINPYAGFINELSTEQKIEFITIFDYIGGTEKEILCDLVYESLPFEYEFIMYYCKENKFELYNLKTLIKFLQTQDEIQRMFYIYLIKNLKIRSI